MATGKFSGFAMFQFSHRGIALQRCFFVVVEQIVETIKGELKCARFGRADLQQAVDDIGDRKNGRFVACAQFKREPEFSDQVDELAYRVLYLRQQRTIPYCQFQHWQLQAVDHRLELNGDARIRKKPIKHDDDNIRHHLFVGVESIMQRLAHRVQRARACRTIFF